MKYRHYAPKAPVRLFEGPPDRTAEAVLQALQPGDGVLCFEEYLPQLGEKKKRLVYSLGWSWDYAEHSRRLFSLLRRFDHTGARRILAQCPRAFGTNAGAVNRFRKSAGFQCEDCREYAQDRKGQDRTETYQLRDYTAGDSIRQIHWKLSSKRGHPVVREAACPMDQSLLLFVDRTWGSIPPAQADAIMEAAVSVAQALSELGLPFRLCWNDDTIQMRVVGAAEELPEAVAALLKSRTVRGESGSSLYLSTYGIPTAGRILFFGTQYPEEAFLQAAPCKVLLCGMGEACFTPETAAQALRILSWS